MPGHQRDVRSSTELLAPLRRYAALVVGCVVLGLLVAAVVVTVRPEVFRSRAALLVADAPVYVDVQGGSQPPKLITLDTESQRLRSLAVTRGMSAATGDPDPQSHLDISAVPNTSILVIAYRAADPATAQRGARAAAQAYLAVREQELLTRRSVTVTGLESLIGRLQAQLAHPVSESTPRVEAATASARQGTIAASVAEAERQLALAQRTPVAAGEVTRAAALPRNGRAYATVTLPSGAMLGLLVGIGLARRRVRGRWLGRYAEATPLPLLAEVDGDPDADHGRLLLPAIGARHRVLAVLGVAAADSTTVAHGLAAAWARAGQPSALVLDTGLATHPRQAGWLAQDTPPGLQIRPVATSRRAVASQLSTLRRRTDRVVVAAGATSRTSALILTRAVDAVVLVTESGRRGYDLLCAAAADVAATGVAVLGVVVLSARQSHPARHRAIGGDLQHES